MASCFPYKQWRDDWTPVVIPEGHNKLYKNIDVTQSAWLP